MNRPGGQTPLRSAGAQASGGTAVPGVIETIANGFSLVLVYPALIALPLLADAVHWSGIGISPQALAERSSSMADLLESLGIAENLVGLLGLFVPSLLAWVDRDRLFTSGDGVVFVPDTWWLALLVAVAMLLLGAFAHALFRVPLAFVVRRRAMRPVELAAAVVRAWLRLIGLGALAVGVLVLIGLPLMLGGAVLFALGLNIAPLLALLIALPVLIAAVYFYFALDAIAVSDVGPIRACYLSFNVVRRNFWPVVGLIISILLISTGLPVLWLSRADHPIGLLIGVFCNALVSTGLILASMQFYLDRLGRWQRPAGGTSTRVARS